MINTIAVKNRDRELWAKMNEEESAQWRKLSMEQITIEDIDDLDIHYDKFSEGFIIGKPGKGCIRFRYETKNRNGWYLSYRIGNIEGKYIYIEYGELKFFLVQMLEQTNMGKCRTGFWQRFVNIVNGNGRWNEG